jgi:dinuclear metal center YbgI/SA1388 family protein
MPTVGEIFDFLNGMAPVESRMDFDNVGLLLGSPDWTADKVLLSLDITGPVIRQAAEAGAQLVISHHPLFFQLKNLGSGDPQGVKAMELLTHHIAAICMHTNLDAADGGVNDALAAALGVEDAVPFEPEHILRLGALASPRPLPDFLALVREKLDCAGLRYVPGSGPVSRVAVGGGSCGGMLEEAAKAGCDTFVTADVKYDVFLRAKELGVNLIDAGHFNTENVVIPVLQAWLRESFPALRILLADHRQTERYFV